MTRKKVIFLDAGEERVARGEVSYDGVFIVVTNEFHREIKIHQDRIVFIKDINMGGD